MEKEKLMYGATEGALTHFVVATILQRLPQPVKVSNQNTGIQIEYLTPE